VPKLRLPFVTRREMLAWMGVAGATSALATTECSSSSAPSVMPVATTPPKPIPAYFTSQERTVLGVLADAVLPPDDAPGGNALGAVDYIENLLTAFERDTPFIFAGGPYSGRAPVPNSDGSPSGVSPPDDFSSFLPLDRVALRAWQLIIYGSSGVPGGGPNDNIPGPGAGPASYGWSGVTGGGLANAATTGPGTGPVIGLRDAVASAIKQAEAALPVGVAIDSVNASQGAALLTALDATTQSTIIELVLEGCFTAPEYGGNKNQAGWTMMYFEGDSQPYGYSTYDETTSKYIDHADHPCASANPGTDPMPMDTATETLLGLAFGVLGGKTFG
jgi:hypothetical protein